MRLKYLSFFIALLFRGNAYSAPLSVTNGSFESFEYNEILDFNIPLSWSIENHAAVIDNLHAQNPSWKIENPLEAINGNYFLVLATNGNGVNFAKAHQQVSIYPGKSISGFYFFGTNGPVNSNDYASIKLIPNSNTLSEIVLVFIEANQVGDYNSLQNWQYFEYSFEPNQAGLYQLELAVADINDNNNANYFCIDNLEIKPVISNGNFELYQYDLATESNLPLFWQIHNNAYVVKHFIPDNRESTAKWKINPFIGLAPAQDSNFLVADSGPNFTINYGRASQRITVNQGDGISGFYFFGTSDYDAWNDNGTIRLTYDPNNNVGILLVYIDVNMVGNYSSMEGWKRFDYIFNSNESGTYYLKITARDINDYNLKSYLCVDGLAVCDSPSKSDFYIDCKVDLIDLDLFAKDWLINCSNPNYANNPDFSCFRGTDLSKDGIVNMKDFAAFAKDWLVGYESE